MTATTVMSAPSGVFVAPIVALALLVLVVGVPLWLVAAYVRGVRYERSVRRIVATVFVAVGAVLLLPTTVAAQDDGDVVIMRARCETFERFSAEWWFHRCFLFDDGGDPPLMTATSTPPPPAPVADKPKKKATE